MPIQGPTPIITTIVSLRPVPSPEIKSERLDEDYKEGIVKDEVDVNVKLEELPAVIKEEESSPVARSVMPVARDMKVEKFE